MPTRARVCYGHYSARACEEASPRGSRRASLTSLPRRSRPRDHRRAESGSTVPLDIGRGGTAGKYWTGKIDDVPIWNLVRAAPQIAGAYQTEFTTTQSGLVGNWKLDDAAGTLATDSATVTRTCAYNGDGLLQSETGSATTTLLWDPASSPAKLLVLNTDRIVYAGAPLYIAHANGTATTLALDGLGSVRAELADAGPLLKSFRYAAYGTLIGASSGLPSLLGYTGELTDASGLVYLRARWYDPPVGRFASRDPLAGTAFEPSSLNRFGYVAGNPIVSSDPSGMCQDPGGSGVRYCISRWIPTRFACPNICGVGDNRPDPSPVDGGYRVQQLIRSDRSVHVDASESALGLFGRPRAPGIYHDCGASITSSGVLSMCVATNGFRNWPFGSLSPGDILWAVSISGDSIAVRGSRYPFHGDLPLRRGVHARTPVFSGMRWRPRPTIRPLVVARRKRRRQVTTENRVYVASRALGTTAGLAALLGVALATRAWLQPNVSHSLATDLNALGDLILVGVAGVVTLVVGLAPPSPSRTGLFIGAGLLLLPTGAGYGGTSDGYAFVGGLLAFVGGALAMTRTRQWGRALIVAFIALFGGIALAVVVGEVLQAMLR